MVINELSTVPNLFSGSGGHPPISINGRVMPKVTMQPGEVQMWRIANTSSRSGVFLAGISPVPAGMSPIPPSPPTNSPPLTLPTTPSPWGDFQVKQIAQDGVQFLESNYDQTLNQTFLVASGNRADILIKAPANQTGQTQTYAVLYRNSINSTESAGGKPLTRLLVIEVPSGPTVTGNQAQFIASPNYPTFPPFLTDITDAEVKGTKTITFESFTPKFALPAGAPPFTMHTIDGRKFEGNVGEVVLLNTVEEWKLQNRSMGRRQIDHPFHIHINPFQITEIFSPNDTVPNPTAGGNPLPKYVFYNTNLAPGQCYLNPNDTASWNAPSTPNSSSSWGPTCPPTAVPAPRIWWDVFPIPSGIGATDQGGNTINGPDGKQIVVPGHFKMRSRFVDFTGTYVIHCHILAHEDRGMMTVVQVVPFTTPYSHQ
jgi:FtsP/CotA-like multicopper oxidase with cupredoxin domain